MSKHSPHRPRIGIALGSGSARGWAHIGVLAALSEAGVEPDIVCGTSIGALVGGIYAHGHLEALERWVSALTRGDVFRHMDLALLSGGLIEGARLMDVYRAALGDPAIEELNTPYAAVATNLSTGREVWLQSGSMLEAIRASVSLPGLFRPVHREGHWLVDGGLVNPVPVSVCRALGADVVIAVNLNGDLVGRYPNLQTVEVDDEPAEASWFSRVIRGRRELAASPPVKQNGGPSFFTVLASSLNIMQDRITRSRMAGDPAEIILTPRLAHLELLDFARGKEAIEEGRRAVRRMLPLIEDALGLEKSPTGTGLTR